MGFYLIDESILRCRLVVRLKKSKQHYYLGYSRHLKKNLTYHFGDFEKFVYGNNNLIRICNYFLDLRK